MLLLWLLWIVLLVPALIAGARMLSALTPAEAHAAGDWAFIAVWLGLFAIADVLLLAALSGPLTPVELASVLIAVAAIGLAHRSTRQAIRAFVAEALRRRGVVLTSYALTSLAAAFAAAMPVYLYDTGLYHYPLMAWLAEYGDVRGLALLHFRFALVTSWLTIPATVDHGIFSGRTSSFVNGFAFALIAVQIAVALMRWWKSMDDESDRFIACAGGGAAAYALAAGFVNSASPDLPGLFLPAVIVWLSLRWSRNGAPAAGLLLALLLFAVKLSTLPVVAATGLFMAWRSSPASLVKWAAVAAVIIAPMLLTSVVVSGCLLFPVDRTCLALPWSLPPHSAAAYAKIITEWARWGGPTPPQADFAAWWTQWAARKSNIALALLIAVSLATGLALRRSIRHDPRIAFAAVLAVLGVSYVVVLAPDLRFAVGYLAILPSLYVARRQIRKVAGRETHWRGAVATGAIVLMLGSAFVVDIVNAGRTIFGSGVRPSPLSWLVLPPKFAWLRGNVGFGDTPDPVSYLEENNGNFSYRRPADGDQCWDIALPCSPFPLPSDIALRKPDEGLAGGFVRR